MAKNKKRKGSAKSKDTKSKRGHKVTPTPSDLCNNCNQNESTETVGSCDHKFCKDCFENLAVYGSFHCSLCDDNSISDIQEPNVPTPNGVGQRFLEPILKPELKHVEEFIKLGKGVKKISSFTHSVMDSTERFVVDKEETFICINPVDRKVFFFSEGKLFKSVKYLYNHGFTGGLALDYNENILLVLQGAKLTSICYYTKDGKFRTSAFFRKKTYAHHIAVGTNNYVFALDAHTSSIHFFNKDKKMFLTWTLKTLLLQRVDLWDCTLLVSKDNRLFLFDSVNLNLYEVVNDDEVIMKVTFTDETVAGPELTTSGGESEGSTASLPTIVYESMWTKKPLTYDDEDVESSTSTDVKEQGTPNTSVKPSTILSNMLQDIKEDSKEGSEIAISIVSETNDPKHNQENKEKAKGGKKGKGKGKGGKKKKSDNLNKNNNANGSSGEDSANEETPENTSMKTTNSLDQETTRRNSMNDLSLQEESENHSDTKNNEANIQQELQQTISQPIIRNVPLPRRIFNPREHPPLLVFDRFDCMILAYRGQIALFSPQGQYIKTILDLIDLDENHYKVTIKQIIPFADDKLAVLWHKHGCRYLYRFFEVYTYTAPKKYRRIKSMYGRRKFTYEMDVEFENWSDNRAVSTCCCLQ